MTTTGYRESGWHLQMFSECLPCARFQEADTAAHVLFSGAEYSKPGRKYRK